MNNTAPETPAQVASKRDEPQFEGVEFSDGTVCADTW